MQRQRDRQHRRRQAPGHQHPELAPRLRAGSRDRIAAGTPVTVEPGVYLPGFGGVRIEDLAVARPGGHELLTTTPKELLEL